MDTPAPQPEGSLVNFEYTGRFYDRRFLLTLGKADGAVAVDIDASELLAVVVIDSHLPVAVPATPILVQSAGFPSPCLLFHG